MTLNILFLHQNFPGQYKLLSQELSSRTGVKVVAVGQRSPFENDFGAIEYLGYRSRPDSGSDLFPPLAFFSEQARRGDAVRWKLLDLKEKGFSPDLCFVHPGWGEALFLRDVFPYAKIVPHLEFYYRSRGSDLDFDPEFHAPSIDLDYMSLRNLPTLQAAALADRLISSTAWQASTFPTALSQRISVIHEGINTAVACPAPARPLRFPSGDTLEPGQVLITYVARSLEPYRGFHVFMRSLPRLLKILPHAQVAIVGQEKASYGRPPQQAGTWKQAMLEELGSVLDPGRVHFLGRLSYPDLINLFRLSTVHVYLTYPFVLSWSLLDAMSCGCAVVGSATDPVMEVIRDHENGILTDFIDAQKLAYNVAELAESVALRARLSNRARMSVVERYDFRTVCLPAYDRLMAEVLSAP